MNLRLWGAVFILLTAVYYYRKHQQQKAYAQGMSFVSLASQKEVQACQAKNECMVVYVAPWCPACHQFIQQYGQFKTRLEQKNIGIVFIVGADENRQKEIAMKDELSPVGVLDSLNHDFMKTYKINSFPSVFVTDKSGKVLHAGKSSYDFLNKKLNEQ